MTLFYIALNSCMSRSFQVRTIVNLLGTSKMKKMILMWRTLSSLGTSCSYYSRFNCNRTSTCSFWIFFFRVLTIAEKKLFGRIFIILKKDTICNMNFRYFNKKNIEILWLNSLHVGNLDILIFLLCWDCLIGVQFQHKDIEPAS